MYIDFLYNRFEDKKEKTAIIFDGRKYSYADIISKIKALKKVLFESQITEGSVVSIESDNPFYSIAFLLTMIEMNYISLPLTIDSIQKFEEYFEIAQINYSISCKDDSINIASTGRKGTNNVYQKLRTENHPGLILFSSGTSGKSKAAVHDLTKLLKKYRIIRKDYITLAFMLFDHIGGVDTILYSLSNTSTIVFPKDRMPDTICKNIEDHRIEVLPATPTFLNLLLLSETNKKYDLSSLKYITYGTEPMPKHTLDKLFDVFPNVQLLQKYGTTEVGTLRSKSESKNSDWVKIGGEGYSTRIVDGILQIKAESAMLGYLNAPSPFTDDGWFITGDEVLVNGDYYRILGRRSEIINVGGEKVYPAEVENVIQQLDFVEDVIVSGEENLIMGNIVIAKIKVINKPSGRNKLKKIIKDHCKNNLQEYKVPLKITFIDDQLHSMRFKKIRNFE